MSKPTASAVPVADKNTEARVQPLFTGGRQARLKVQIRSSVWKKSWMWLVVVPFLLACLYFGALASNRYVSEAKVIVKQADALGQKESGISLFGSMAAPGMLDAQLLREYVLSLDMLHYLEEVLSLRAHYQSDTADSFSRLGSDASQEEFLEYYRSHLDVSYDELSGILTLRIQAFDADYGRRVMQTILKRSEEFINQIGHRMAREQVGFVQGELERAQEQLRTNKQQVLAFQNKYNFFNPEDESGARLKVVNEMEAELARDKAQLKKLLSYMSEASAEVVALRARIKAMEAQVAVERGKLVGERDGLKLNDLNAQFADLRMNVEFATDVYRTSLLSLEQARIEAHRKLKHLVVVDSPSLAEKAEYPHRLYNLATLLIVLSIVYGVGMIVLATIREHRDV